MKNMRLEYSKGFTIVELIIVIIIIGLLTAIVSVSYSTYQKRSIGSVISADLVSAQSAIKLGVLNNNETFGLPSDFKSSQDVSVSVYGDSVKQYCLEGSHSKYSDLTYYLLSSEKEAKSGKCFDNQLSPVAWWKLNGDGADSSGYGRALIITGATPASDLWGNTSGAYSFTGPSNYLSVASGQQPSVNTKLSVSAWIKPTSWPASGLRTIVVGAYYLSLSYTGAIQSYWYSTTPAGYHTTTSNQAPVNLWTHAVATWDGVWARLYVNGQLKTSVAVTGTGTTSTTRIGAEGPDHARQFYGSIDDVRIYSRALSDSEIDGLYEYGPE